MRLVDEGLNLGQIAVIETQDCRAGSSAPPRPASRITTFSPLTVGYGAHTEVDAASGILDAELTVLRSPAFRSIHVCHDLNTSHNRFFDVLRNRHHRLGVVHQRDNELASLDGVAPGEYRWCRH